MNDPYKVLNIAPSATDDEVKHAYRELARKYHPDNYHDNPLADLSALYELEATVLDGRYLPKAALDLLVPPCSQYAKDW